MKILLFEWRDIKNPNAGGSEIYFHELAKRWVKLGNQVTILCGGWKNCKRTEYVDGINIIRIGSAKTLYLLAPFKYLSLKEKFDVLIDVENGVPFFTPFFAKTKKILHLHHVHKDVWFKELNPFIASIGWVIENKIMPKVYRKIPIITISKSSEEEVKKEKIGRVVGIVNPGINFLRFKKTKKYKEPTILFLNRIKKYKGLDILLEAVKELNKDTKFKLLVAGSGDYLETAKNYVQDNKLENVKFLGRVSDEEKEDLMKKSWIFINPSFKEGWGIVNIESNYLGTPVIGSNVSGIKDSVVDGKTGLLFEYGNYKQLAFCIKKLLKNYELRSHMEKVAIKWSKEFNWDKKAKEYLGYINQVVKS